MSTHTSNLHQSATGIFGLVCLNLALVPSAFAQVSPNIQLPNIPIPGQTPPTPAPAPVSTPIFTVISNASGFSNASGIATTSLIGKLFGKDGVIPTEFQPYSQQIIASAQGINSDLSTAAANYAAALAALAQAQAGSPGTAPAPVVDNTQRFSVRGANASDCGCKNPDAVAVPGNSGAELASAKAAEAKAATELLRAQQAARQFLATNKKAPQVSAGITSFSPIW